MIRNKIAVLCLALSLATVPSMAVYADTTEGTPVTTMENCGAYLFEWRPVDCGDGRYFAILNGGSTINEGNVILRRGYDYAYTFNAMEYPRPWGQAPNLINVNGVWAIPENQPLLPEGTQNTLQIVLVTNNKNLPNKERYIDVVKLPNGVKASDLPPEVRKYLINVDGSDAGAYDGTETTGWEKDDNGQWKYRKPDATYVSNSWLNVDDNYYYMNAEGVMLADTITPDGSYVNAKGEKQKYMPGWFQNEKGWKFVQKNGYFAASTWVKDTDDKWYYFDMGGYMKTDYDTPDGFHVGSDGVWDGQPTTVKDTKNLGPGFAQNETQDNVQNETEQTEGEQSE